MRCNVYVGSVVLVLVISSLLLLAGDLVVTGNDSPYLSGVWLHKAWNEDMTKYMLCRWNSDLTEPGVGGTGLCVSEDPMEVPTPEGGTMVMSAEMQGPWVMDVPGEYKAKALAFITSEGVLIGTVEITGTMVREEEGKMTANWNHKIVDLEGNVLTELPPMEAELIRIDIE